MELDLELPVAELTRVLVDVPSVSGDEVKLADAVEAALVRLPGLTVRRDGDAVVARTDLGRPSRVVLAGHLDTVPIAGNLPARRVGGRLYGCGTSDMKAGLAVMLRLAATLAAAPSPRPSTPPSTQPAASPAAMQDATLTTRPVAPAAALQATAPATTPAGTPSDPPAMTPSAIQPTASAAPAVLRHDVTWVFYDNEEVEAVRNGLRRLAAAHRDWLDADMAILLEPTSGAVEAGCQGTLRVVATVTGRRAHTARWWLGENAIHRAAPLLARLADYQARTVTIDGCTYREGMSVVQIAGGVAGNVVPDSCEVTVNFRFAPDRDEPAALAHVREVLDGFDLEVVDSAAGAMPGLSAPAVADFVAAAGREPVAKYGWTDVAQFAALGIPAINYGPGDPNLAHTRDEYVEMERIAEAEAVLRIYLTSR